jgi:alkyl hydroperoxide reductase subunit AhpC
METLNEKKGISLFGDNFSEMNVQITNGVFELPSYFKGKWFVLFS